MGVGVPRRVQRAHLSLTQVRKQPHPCPRLVCARVQPCPSVSKQAEPGGDRAEPGLAQSQAICCALLRMLLRIQ